MFLTKMYQQIHQCVSCYEFSMKYADGFAFSFALCTTVTYGATKLRLLTAGLCQMTTEVTCRVSTTLCHQPLYWKHLRKYAANESVYRASLSSLTQAIFKTLTLHNKKLRHDVSDGTY